MWFLLVLFPTNRFLLYYHRQLGGQVATEPRQVTHLVLTRLLRSVKLLLALPVANHIISSRWLVDSASAGHFLPITSAYEWDDDTFKKTFFCDIQRTIRSPARNKLFDGRAFYMTPSVNPNIRNLTSLIEMSGGTVERHRRSAVRIAETITQQPNSYTILSCTKDLHLLLDLLRSPGNAKSIICATEFVLTSIMTQTIDMEKHVIQYV